MAQDNDAVYVYDEGDLRKYRTEIPNIVDDMNLTPHAYRLYGHLKRVAGAKEGSCWQNTDTLAQICNMSTGMVSRAKGELVEAGLIVIGKKRVGRNEVDNIRILDIWARNFAAYGPQTATPSREIVTPSQYEPVASVTPSQYETKKEPSQEETNKENISHAEKSNVDFSRGAAQQSMLDDDKLTVEQPKKGSTSVKFKREASSSKQPSQKPPTPRQPDALFDAIAETWNSAPGMTGKIKQQLAGKIPGDSADSASNFDVPATPDEVRAFGEWYAKKCIGCDMPLSRPAIQTHFYKFRREQGEAARKSGPTIREENGRRFRYDRDIHTWLDIGPARQPATNKTASGNEAYAS